MENNVEIIKAHLPESIEVHLEATNLGGEQLVGFGGSSFQDITNVIEGIAKSLVATLQKAHPRKASVEFGLEFAVESGKLITVVVKGSSTANLKITLEWGELS
jgi:hypothetical protein